MVERSTAEQRKEARPSSGAVFILTGGLTDQGDTFLIGVAAVVLTAVLYPLIGTLSFLAFPIVLLGVVLRRRHRRGRRKRPGREDPPAGLPSPVRSGLEADAPPVDGSFVRTATEIVDELETLMGAARPVPLTDQVRVDKDRLSALLDELRQSLDAGRIA